MTSISRLLLLSAAFALPSVVSAADVSDAGARAIEETLANGLANPGAISVKVAGERYDVVFDIRKAVETRIAPWTLKQANAVVHSLAPGANGLWTYSGKGKVTFSADLAAADRSSSLTLNIGSFENKGIFDESLRFIREGTFEAKDLVFGTRSARDNFKFAVKDYMVQLGFAEAKPGIGDLTADVTLQDVSQTFGAFPNPETRLGGQTVTGRFTFKDVDFNGLGRLVDFWSGSARGKSMDALSDAEAAALSGIIAKHAPFATRLGEDTRVDGVAISWAGTSVKIGNLAYHWTVENMGGDAALDLGANASNLVIDAEKIPPVLRKALPREAGLRMRYSGFNLAAMWATMADAKVLRRSLVTKDYYTRKIMPDGMITVLFDGTYLRSDYYDFTLSGSMVAPVDAPDKPEIVDLRLTARNFDKTIKFLQDMSKDDPRLSQASFTAMVIKGFGKAQADGSVLWHFAKDEGGGLTVNGQPVPTR